MLHQQDVLYHLFKESYNVFVLNISLFVGFLIILGIVLLFKYKGKLTPKEIEIKDKEKQQYILSKIKNFQQAKRVAHQELITGLPTWESEYDIIHSKK